MAGLLTSHFSSRLFSAFQPVCLRQSSRIDHCSSENAQDASGSRCPNINSIRNKLVKNVAGSGHLCRIRAIRKQMNQCMGCMGLPLRHRLPERFFPAINCLILLHTFSTSYLILSSIFHTACLRAEIILCPDKHAAPDVSQTPGPGGVCHNRIPGRYRSRFSGEY